MTTAADAGDTSASSTGARSKSARAVGGRPAPQRRGMSPRKGSLITLVVAAALTGLIVLFVWLGNSFGSTDGGHVAIVRNGGPFDNTSIRQVLAPNSGHTNIGEFSTLHDYPTSQRFFTISSTGNGDSDDIVQVPTEDGVTVGIEGTAYFTLNTAPANDYAVIKDFDNKYGTRQFKCFHVAGGALVQDGSRNVYDGDTGFSCFLDQIVSPIINNDLRVAVGDLKCAELQASCSLVKNSTSGTTGATGTGNVNLARIESTIGASLQSDLNETLGGQFLTNVRFNLQKIDLPKQVQAAIDSAQASFAQVTQAQARQKTALIEAQTRVQQAQLDAQADEERQKGYTNCPTCSQIDIVKALPQSITVYAPGNSKISIPTK